MNDLNKNWYADSINKKYPLDSQQAVLDSYKLYTNDKKDFSLVKCAALQAKFDKAKEFYGIQDKPLNNADQDTIQQSQDGFTVAMPKMASTSGILKLAGQICKSRDLYPRKQLSKAAKMLLKQALTLQGVDQDTFNTPEMRAVEQIAGAGVGYRQKIQDEFLKRASLMALKPSLKSKYMQSCLNLQKMDDQSFYKVANLENMCNTLQDIDNMYNLKPMYGKQIQRPQHVCFEENMADMAKTANNWLYIPSIDTILNKTALQERQDQVLEYFGDKYGVKETNIDVCVSKIASLSRSQACAFIKEIQDGADEQ